MTTSQAGQIAVLNGVVGGTIALLRATLSNGKNMKKWRAFLGGSIGGGIHGLGKVFLASDGSSANYLGSIISSIGVSVTSNAGASRGLLDEVSVPIGPVRLRASRDSAQRRVRASINLYDAMAVVRVLADDRMRVDAVESRRRGIMVVTFAGTIRESYGRQVDGFSQGPVVAINQLRRDSDVLWRHEVTHYLQQQFLQENVGMPVERGARRLLGDPQWLPNWIEAGVVPDVILRIEHVAARGDRGPLLNLLEDEATWFERGRRRD